MTDDIKHLDINHNHEAGLIPFATQQYIRQQAAEIERLKKLCEHALELADTFALPNAPLALKVAAARAALKEPKDG